MILRVIGINTIFPLLSLLATSLILYLFDSFKIKQKWLYLLFTMIGLAASFFFSWHNWTGIAYDAGFLLNLDKFTSLGWMLLILISSVFTVLSISGPNDNNDEAIGSRLAQNLMVLIGALLVISADNLLLVWLSMMLLAISSLKTFIETDDQGWKIPLIAIMLFCFGVISIFGSYGILSFSNFSELQTGGFSLPDRIYLYSIIGIFVAPIFWFARFIPFGLDVHKSNNGLKLPAIHIQLIFAVIAQFIFIKMSGLSVVEESPLFQLIPAFALVTAFWGNIAALREENLTKWFGFLLLTNIALLFPAVILLAEDPEGLKVTMLLQLSTFLLGIIGFAIVLHETKDKNGKFEFKNLRGLKNKSAWLTFAMVAIMLSLAGLPLSFGFISRYQLLEKLMGSGFVLMVILVGLNIVIMAANFIRALNLMFFEEADDETIEISHTGFAILFFVVLGIVYFGILPNIFIEFITSCVK